MGGSPGVVSLFISVLATIKLHDNAGLGAEEVNDIRASRNLPPPLQPLESTITQGVPKFAFDVCLFDP
jgi:hypothetical protein